MTIRCFFFFNFVISSLLFPVCFPVMINSKTLKTKRAKVFVFKGSKEAGDWGDSTPGVEVNNSRGWSGWKELNSWKGSRLSPQACLKKQRGRGMKLCSSWNEGNGLNSIVILSCFVFRCTSLFSIHENEANVYLSTCVIVQGLCSK